MQSLGISPEQWSSFIGIIAIGILVVRWLSKQLESEREYSRQLSEAYKQATIQFISTMQETTATVTRLQDSVERNTTAVNKCRGQSNHEN